MFRGERSYFKIIKKKSITKKNLKNFMEKNRFFMEVLYVFWSLKQLCRYVYIYIHIYIHIYIYGVFRTNGVSNIKIQLTFFQCHALPISNISFSEKGQKRIRHLIIPYCGTLSSTTQGSNAWNCRMNSTFTNHAPYRRIFHLCHRYSSIVN